MDIRIVDQDDENLHIVIHCREIDNEVMRLKAHIELFDRKLRAKSDNEHYCVNLSEVHISLPTLRYNVDTEVHRGSFCCWQNSGTDLAMTLQIPVSKAWRMIW